MKHRKSRYTSSRSRNRSGNHTGKKLALAAVPLSLAIGGVALMLLTGGKETMDAQFCYARADQFRHAVFIDSSMVGHTASQLRDYQTALERAYTHAPANSKLMLFTTSADSSGSLAKPVYELCKPAQSPAEQEVIGAPSKPSPYLRKQAEEAFAAYRQATKAILRDVQDSSKAAMSSPILEQLRSISQYDGFQGGSRHLTVITDGIQNSTLAEFCRVKGHMPSFDQFSQRPDYEITIKPHSYAQTDISLLMMEVGVLPNAVLPYCSNNELKHWWHQYFTRNGASSVELTPLQFLTGQ